MDAGCSAALDPMVAHGASPQTFVKTGVRGAVYRASVIGCVLAGSTTTTWNTTAKRTYFLFVFPKTISKFPCHRPESNRIVCKY